MGNPVTQFQILAKKPDEMAAFLAALFDWKVDADNPMGYRRIDTGASEGIQGGIWPAPPQAPDFVQLFVTVADVKDAVARAQRLGAKTLIPPSVLPEGDEMAVMMGPSGMSFGLWRASGN